MDELKWCGKCMDNLPLERFGKDICTKDGLTRYCKSCRKSHYKESLTRTSKDLKIRIKKDPNLIKGFSEQHKSIKKIVEVLFKNPEYKPKEIAPLVGLSEASVYTYLHQNAFLKSLRQTGAEKITKLIPRAVQSLEESLNAQSEDVKLRATVKVLESEKVLGPERVDVTVNDLSQKSYNELAEILSNIKVPETPPIVEAEVIE